MRQEWNRGGIAVLLALGCAMTAAGALPALAAEGTPLAVVDSQRISEEYEAARDAQEAYQKFMRELEMEVAEKEKELAALADDIESQKLLLGEDALATKVQQFEQKRAEYFEFRDGVEQRAEQEYTTRITPILDQIRTIVERLGKERGYGLIVDSAALSVLFISPDYDLTNEVLAALAKGGE